MNTPQDRWPEERARLLADRPWGRRPIPLW